MPHRDEVDVEVTVTAVKRPKVIADRWDDPGGHAAAEAGHPVPSFGFLALEDPGEITVPVAHMMEQVRDELVDVPRLSEDDTEGDAVWQEFELRQVLPDDGGEMQFRLFARSDLKDYQPAVKRARFIEQSLHRAVRLVTNAKSPSAREAGVQLLLKTAMVTERMLWEFASGAPL